MGFDVISSKENLTIMSQKIYTFCDMDKGYSYLIKNKISEAQPGEIFIHSDFSDFADSAAIRKCLSRMVENKEIRRIKPGIYDKPRFSNLLQENLPPDPDKVAKAIARNFHWTIAPCGDQAMNILGLSTQVPVVWSYLSDGPYKEYDIDKIKITFKHRTNREISKMSYISSTVIQALKELGKEHVTEDTIKILSSKIKAEEKAILLKETVNSTEWIYKIIQRVCKE